MKIAWETGFENDRVISTVTIQSRNSTKAHVPKVHWFRIS